MTMKHFDFDELVRSNVARVQGFENEPYFNNEPDVYKNLESLVDNVLDPVQELVAAPVVVTSGYRCERLNALVGDIHGSQHRTGHAADFFVKGFSRGDMGKLYAQLCQSIDFDQLILYASQGIIHVSYVDKATNRHEAMIELFGSGRM